MKRSGIVAVGALVLGALAGCGQSTSNTDAGASGDAPSACPAISGTYLIAFDGCEVGLYDNPVTITLDSSCDATFESSVAKTIPPITGVVSLAADGSFAATDLMIGNATLSCTGAPGASDYVVSCGACTITLTPPS